MVLHPFVRCCIVPTDAKKLIVGEADYNLDVGAFEGVQDVGIGVTNARLGNALLLQEGNSQGGLR